MLLAPPDKTQAGLATSAEEPQRFPAQDVGVNVENGLPGIGISVEDNPIPTLEHTFKLSNPPSGQRNVSKQLRIRSSQLPQVPIPLLRHDEHMNPSLRPNIPKRKGRLILIDNISRDLTSNNPLKEHLGIITHGSTLPSRPPHSRHAAHRPNATPPHPTGTERRSRGVRGRAPGWGPGGLTPRKHTASRRQLDEAKRSEVPHCGGPWGSIRRSAAAAGPRGEVPGGVRVLPSGAPKRWVAR